ncbi:MAG TPA: hypothetical protein VIV09_17030 [Pseudolabrys sp.]
MTDEYDGPERRRGLSEADIERIAEVAARKALDKVYLEVGKGVLKRLSWIIGVSTVALLMWMGGKGIHLQ